ncbi:MAG: DUF2851 family protein [Microscillaceae bacterium]|nr:DUF2851 family protein [Microscillaceae bacterium]
MKEDFLHFVWRFQYFDQKDLQTQEGKSLQIIAPGQWHQDAGPDFEMAHLRIDGQIWQGHVEIHVRASDWERHGHHQNPAYQNVVLHVVWEDDQPARRLDGTLIPALELKNRLPSTLWSRYRLLLESLGPVPCHALLEQAPALARLQMLDKTLTSRLEAKSSFVRQHWQENGQDWETTAYQLLAQNFGFKTNAAPFLRLAQVLPLKILQKHRHEPLALEALLFGQAGLIPTPPPDAYSESLLREYDFLAHKYYLKPHQLEIAAWKFLRLRPANFPTLRLAQFAQLMSREGGLFAWLTEGAAQELLGNFQLSPTSYWQSHYRFGQAAQGKVPLFGKSARHHLLINAVVPLWAALALEKQAPEWMEKAAHLLEKLPAERNRILSMWEGLGLKVQSAYDSQALIELYQHYCLPKRCLSCSIGLFLLRNP